MITCISSLSVELVGIHVFSYLPLAAMVRLDSAVVQRRHRGAIEAAFAVSTVQTVYKICNDVSWQKRQWQWCVKKHVKIQGLKLTEADAKEMDLFQEASSGLHPTASCNAVSR
jgi:hypothetical protein